MKKTKRILALVMSLVLVIGCAALFAGCGDKTEGGKKYIIATDIVFAPFEFDRDGKKVGIDIDLLAAIAEDQGFEYELKPLAFNSAVAALESNQVDGVIAGMSITEERKLKYDFSETYYDSCVAVAVKAGNDAVKTMDDLEGKKVAVKTGTQGASYAESVKDKYGFQIVYFDKSPMMYEDVKTGNTVACFEDYPVMAYGVQQNNGLQIINKVEEFSSPYGFAVLKGKNPELIEMFNKGLANIKANGKYEEIVAKYTGNN